ncbi:hypothetical protein P9D39_03615 [Heyndrickxia oleronia]|uniref:Uncharacterized protein n=1 Tax=Heyndrickxia oleronia TaxID=38875 RepID=A0A8E2IAZ6_9BACI|nr:hypothetical protein [Heyndrickxia oleronia]MEC1373399.1 hypothetical protein [Heyndrickxia oleronia]OOP69552.1 hypothetical protein BWZ43_04745 [Heyndrickxia oleronia]QQZ04305.1 hypothetical protein I5818_21925 [Heyndrickxia oleronia]
MPKYLIKYHTVSGKEFEQQIEASSLNAAKATAMMQENHFEIGKHYAIYINTDHVVATEVTLVEEINLDDY